MKNFRQILTLIALAFCLATFAQTKQTNLKTDSANIIIPFKQNDTTYWVNNFREFREAIFLGDKAKAKIFFNFPINNSENEIWHLAYDNNEIAIDKLQGKAKPFTGADLDKYFNQIFSKNFIKTLLKIKADELYKKGIYETPKYKDSLTTYILYSTFDKTDKTLVLNFASKTEFKDLKGKPLDGGELNIIYYFEITEQGHIKFKQIRLAG